MRKDLMDILVCPVCKGTLKLHVEEEQGSDVIKGHLVCTTCIETYPIVDSIPDLLPPDIQL